MLPAGAEPNIRVLLDSTTITYESTEDDFIDVFNEACQYLQVYGKSPESGCSKKIVVVKELLFMNFYFLMNNLPLEWTYGIFKEAMISLHDLISRS